MLPSMMTQEFTRKRYPKVSDHGNLVVDRKGVPATAVFYGSIQPGTGMTDLVNRDGAEIAYTILARPDSDVKHNDILTLAGQDYFVNGEPERWETGILDHTVIRLSRWSG